MAFSSNGLCYGYIDEDSMCYLVISVKNRNGTEHIGLDFLSRESVEGVLQKKKKTPRAQSHLEMAQAPQRMMRHIS